MNWKPLKDIFYGMASDAVREIQPYKRALGAWIVVVIAEIGLAGLLSVLPMMKELPFAFNLFVMSAFLMLALILNIDGKRNEIEHLKKETKFYA